MAKATRGSARIWAGLLTVALGLGGCSFDIAAPSLVNGEELDTPENTGIIMAGVQADFECALAHYIVSTGLFGSELAVGSVFNVIKDIDKRDLSPVNSIYTSLTCSGNVEQGPGLYKPLSTARWQADHALELLEGWTDAEVANRPRLIATAGAYAGYGLLLLGESMCTAAIDVGPEMTPAQLFQEAEARFTRGIAAAQTVTGDTELLHWNLVGRARARHRLNNLSGAAADAAQVPISFVKNATYSTDSPRRENLVWVHGQRSRIFTVAPSYRSLTFGGVADPRVPVTTTGDNAADGVTPLWITSKYSGNSAPIPFATGVEARLIVAEAEGGQAAVTIINELHARVGLPNFSSTDPEEIRNQIIEERQREFFLTGHHLGDARHYAVPLLPAAGTPVPPLYGSGVYGSATCFSLPEIERVNNPSINR